MSAGIAQASETNVLDKRFESANGKTLTIRHCQGHAELDACVDLQQQTWGYPDLETAPRKFFVLAQAHGGHVIGAFGEGEQLVGMAMGFAAFDTGATHAPEPYLHSHMLAVAPAFRGSGLGTRLKLAQREDALARGIRRMTWTFDPLAKMNAYFNLHRLGAVARRYLPDFYGVSSSRLQGGLPTDRLQAEWWLDSPWVTRRIAGQIVPLAPDHTIPLPDEVSAWKNDGGHEGTERARALQAELRERFGQAFAAGLVAADFTQGHYTLLPPEQIEALTEPTLETTA